jgi:aspartate/methionine/tyrosine aminotransferase
VNLSRRLPWLDPENALAAREAERRALGAHLLELTVTNPTQVGLPYPADEIASALADPRVAHYQPSPLGLSSARAAVAADHARRGAAVDPDTIVLTASSSESYGWLMKLLCNPGDVVLVPQPSYPLFDHLLELEGVLPRSYRLSFDGQWQIDFDSVDLEGARAIIVVNPNNPTGSFLTAREWSELGQRAAAAGVAIVVDEVFADYAFAAPPDAVATVATQPAFVPTFCLGGLSKGSGLPQMKAGWITVLGPRARAQSALAALELIADTYLSVSTPVELALPRLLELGGSLRANIKARVARNRRVLADALDASSPCSLLPSQGGWSALLRLPRVMSDEAWALTLLTKEDVVAAPGYFFDLPIEATLVLSLLPAPDVFDEGVRRTLRLVADAIASPGP